MEIYLSLCKFFIINFTKFVRTIKTLEWSYSTYFQLREQAQDKIKMS